MRGIYSQMYMHVHYRLIKEKESDGLDGLFYLWLYSKTGGAFGQMASEHAILAYW